MVASIFPITPSIFHIYISHYNIVVSIFFSIIPMKHQYILHYISFRLWDFGEQVSRTPVLGKGHILLSLHRAGQQQVQRLQVLGHLRNAFLVRLNQVRLHSSDGILYPNEGWNPKP